MAPRTPRGASAKTWNWFRLTTFFSFAGVIFLGAGSLYAARLEEHDPFCASCHTQGESTYYQRTQAAGPVDMASAHAAKTVGCIQCHSGPGLTGRIGAMMVGASDLAAYVSGHYNNPAVVTVPIGDANCLKCHADLTTRRDFNNHFHFFLPQWQRLDPKHAATCVECHQAHVTGGQANAAFMTEATVVPVCQRCHAFAGEGR